MSTHKQERLLKQKPEIVVATPGRFWELLQEVRREKARRMDVCIDLHLRITNTSWICLIFDSWPSMKPIAWLRKDTSKIWKKLSNYWTSKLSSSHFVSFETKCCFVSDPSNQFRQKFVFSATLMLQREEQQAHKKKKPKRKSEGQDKLGLFRSEITSSSLFTANSFV